MYSLFQIQFIASSTFSAPLSVKDNHHYRQWGATLNVLLVCSKKDPKPHDLMTCPYNQAHQVEHYRMHIHLQKCRKQYSNSGKTTCPINATHVVNDAELDFHVSTCPDRFLFDTQKYVVEDEVAQRELPPIPVVECEENWDTEELTAYVPNTSNKSHIISKVKGATPSERRRARMEGVKNYRPCDN